MRDALWAGEGLFELLLAALVARAAEHLLVLLLAHALAALLDEGTHKVLEPIAPFGESGNPIPLGVSDPGSFNWQDSGFWSR